METETVTFEGRAYPTNATYPARSERVHVLGVRGGFTYCVFPGGLVAKVPTSWVVTD